MAIDVSKHSLLERGVGEVIVRDSLEEKLNSDKKLRVKLGIDPTGPEIHLGHAAPLRKLKAFQDLGHTAVFIVGDYTARIGDPSEKDQSRKGLSVEEVKKNASGYFNQAFKIIDKNKTEVHMQSEWFGRMDLGKFFEIARQVSVAQLMEHETFKKRIANDAPFSLLEMTYPILQGYDSVAVKADVELGATEQKFNLLMGRRIQKLYGQPEQDILTMNYLIGLDGKEKMSKSLGNYIALNDPPNEMYGKVMSIPDNLIVHYYELCTDITAGGLDIIKKELTDGKNPRDVKAELAHLIVEMYYSVNEADQAADEFARVVSGGGKPSSMRSIKLEDRDIRLDDLLMDCKLATSRSAARRLAEQGAVEVDDQKITDPFKTIKIKEGMVVQVGKRNFVKVEIKD